MLDKPHGILYDKYIIYIYVHVNNMKELNEKKLKNSSEKFRVNDVTAFFGITPRILKHYETTGVLAPERADRNDYREYSAEDVMKIQTAERLKNTQLSQREIASYFSGDLDIKRKYGELIALREMIDNLIDVLSLELNDGAPKFSVEHESECLCFCKTYRLTGDALQRYLDTRDAYSSAINAGCLCDAAHTFFVLYDNLFPLPRPTDADAQSQYILPSNAVKDNKTYRVCVPILAAPKKAHNGTVKTVERKKALTMRFAGEPLSGGKTYYMLQDEAMRRGLTLTGRAWTVSETGPNKKTANKTYTMIISAEIE